jgi:hypothetical protein
MAELDTEVIGKEVPQVRVLQCFDCKSVEVIPDYPPLANPDHDVHLHYADEPHGGHTETPHTRALHRVPSVVWDDLKMRRGVVKDMWATTSGFKPEYYDVKDTFKDDAAKCFTAHQRHVPCLDYMDSSKRIQPPTRSAREPLAKDMPRSFGGDRDAIAMGGPTHYLCFFCPVQATVEHAQRKARGEA